MVGGLVLLSLVLITVSFRQPTSGALHSVQGAGATVLRPFEVGAERIARPFRDVYGYFRGLVHAKRENTRLRREVDDLRQQLIQNQNAQQDNVELRKIANYVDSPQFPSQYKGVSARIISRPPTEFEQQVVISAGSADGIHADTPVVTPDGLVGRVTDVTSSAAQVTLITDGESAVQAVDQHSGAFGLVRHGQGEGQMIMDLVGKSEDVQPGDVIVTAGTRSKQYPSLFPRGIPIGQVTSVGQTDTAPYKAIQIQLYVNVNALNSVTALVTKKRVPVSP